jgi:hypothetical protein
MFLDIFGHMICMDLFNCFWIFLGGYWALFEARSWGEVGRWLPNSDLYKPSLLEAMEEDIQSRFMLNIFQAKAIFMQGSC